MLIKEPASWAKNIIFCKCMEMISIFAYIIEIIAGQCRINPWPTIPDVYRIAGCIYITGSKVVQGVFLPPAVWTCRVPYHHHQYGLAGCPTFHLRTVFVNVWLSGIRSALYQNGKECRCRNQFGIGMLRLPDCDIECRNADAGFSSLDADAKLC